MRLLVTGRGGQVAQSLLERGSKAGVDVVTLGRPELDLAGTADSIIRAIESVPADVIVSAAAYTQVDRAEDEPDVAFAVNERGAAAVARAAARKGIPLIHLSTDYVFSGTQTNPYLESDPTAPASVYGSSKLAGERAVLTENSNSTILRIAWVYSPFGANFVKTMLRLAFSREEIDVVSDQRGNPTCALDVADAILIVAKNLLTRNDPALRGIFHMTAAGEGSWSDFAEAIFAASRQVGGPFSHVKRIASADYPRPAPRPANSRLNSSKIAELHEVRLPDWHVSLQGVVERLVRQLLKEQ